MPKKTFAPVDLYFTASNRDTLAADLARLYLGLTRNDDAGDPVLVPSAHAPDGNGHALDYVGKIIKTPAIYATDDDEAATPTPGILTRALNFFTGGSSDTATTPAAPKLVTPAEYYEREGANLRLYGPDAPARAEKIRAANFRCGTVVITPATPSRLWA